MGKIREPQQKCAICRHPAPPRSRLCRDCKSALKRARLETAVTQFMPLPMMLSVAGDASVGGHRRHHRHSRPDRSHPSEPRAATALPTRRPHPSTRTAAVVALAALVAAGGITAHFVIQDLNLAGAGAVERSAVQQPVVLLQSAPAAARVSPATAPGDPTAPPAMVLTGAAPATKSPAPVPRAPVVTNAGGATRVHTVPPGRAPSASASVSISAFGPHDEPAVPAPAPSTSVPPPVREASPPADRWQAMSEVIAQCAREGLVAGFLCAERARLRYCDGHWGQVAQCQTANRNEYGS